MACLLEVNGLSTAAERNGKYYKILDNISFNIEEGEALGLAGESGCGKSMTALSIVNLLPAAVKSQSGEIIYRGRNLIPLTEKEMRPVRRKEISVVFQEARQSLNPLMRIGKQITETLILCGQKKSRQEMKSRVLNALELFGFDNPQKTYDSYPHQLSGGMCQRVMTIIAAIGNPRLLLADEPSSSLDEESQNRILCELAGMNRNQKTSMLIISHDLSIIRKFCTRFLVMYAGKIVEQGPAQSLFNPLHPYTKALTDAIPGRNKRGKNLENIPGKVPSIEDNLSGCPFAPRCPKAKNICFVNFPPRTGTVHTVHCFLHEREVNNE
ncbi:MAG: ABC transporter ATP-binding protein [Treponema sp.]|nr:ABC transporter ATP-binding protein [Treponema sp.]